MRAPGLTIEDALRWAEYRAALVAAFANRAATREDEPLSHHSLSGLGDVAEELEKMIRAVRQTLDVEALVIELKRLKEED